MSFIDCKIWVEERYCVHFEVEYRYTAARRSLDYYEPDDPAEVEVAAFWVTDIQIGEQFVCDRLLNEWKDVFEDKVQEWVFDNHDIIYDLALESEDAVY